MERHTSALKNKVGLCSKFPLKLTYLRLDDEEATWTRQNTGGEKKMA